MSHDGAGSASCSVIVSAGTGMVASTRSASPNSSVVRRSRSAAVTAGAVGSVGAVLAMSGELSATGSAESDAGTCAGTCAGISVWVGRAPPPQAVAATKAIRKAVRLTNRLGQREPTANT